MIQFKNVSFSYAPEHPVVENLSFSIQAGESVGLIGANGAGKSTIMKLMLGLLQGTGEISVGNIPVNRQNLSEKRSALYCRIPTIRCSCPPYIRT